MDTTLSSHDSDNNARVWRLMEQIDICMLASHDGEKIRARPMTPRVRESENAIYFLSSAQGHTDDELESDGNVCLTFAQSGDGKYLVVTGRARILNDRALIHDLWNTAAEAWWDGPDDPRVCAIEVTPDDAQFWEGPHGVAARMQLTIAAAASAPPDMGDRGKVDLH